MTPVKSYSDTKKGRPATHKSLMRVLKRNSGKTK